MLGECLALLEDLIGGTALHVEIQAKLNELESEMDRRGTVLIRGLIVNVNKIIGDVFPGCGIDIQPSLQGIVEILKPKYDVKIFSNIRTQAAHRELGWLAHTADSLCCDITRSSTVGTCKPAQFWWRSRSRSCSYTRPRPISYAILSTRSVPPTRSYAPRIRHG